MGTTANIAKERLLALIANNKLENEEMKALEESVLDSACEFKDLARDSIISFIGNEVYHLENRGEELRESNEEGPETDEFLAVYEKERSQDELDELIDKLYGRASYLLEYTLLHGLSVEKDATNMDELVERVTEIASDETMQERPVSELYFELVNGHDCPAP